MKSPSVDKGALVLATALACLLVGIPHVTVRAAHPDPVPILRERSSLAPPKTGPALSIAAAATSGGPQPVITFETGVDGQVIQSGIPGVTFSTTDRQDWLYGDIRTGRYNVYPYGSQAYRCNGNFFAWLGPNQGRGRIDFTQGPATSFTVQYSSASTVHLEAYGADNSMLAHSIGTGNLYNPLGTLTVSAPSIAYVIFHDSGNYWLIDDVQITLADVELLSVKVPDSNKPTHQTTGYNDLVLRRGQKISIVVEASPGFDENYHAISISRVRLPDGSEVTSVPATGGANDWYAIRTGVNRSAQTAKITLDLHVPGNAQIGQYSLTAQLNESNGGTVLDTQDCPDTFAIIFNPWSGEDADVYAAGLSATEVTHYALASRDWNYYGSSSSGALGEAIQWNMGTTDNMVFQRAIEQAIGNTSAAAVSRQLTTITRYVSGDPDTDVILGRWGPGFYSVDWKDVPAIVNSPGHPTGQCMDMAALLVSLHRTLGIPTRMLVCEPSGGHGGPVWNFHCWGEVVPTGAWRAADGTYDIGPSPRTSADFVDMAIYSNHMYTYDAAAAARIDIRGLYVVTPSPGTGGATATTTSELGITVEPGKPEYLIGDEVRVNVTVTNNGTNVLDVALNVSVVQEFYNGTMRALPSLGPRPITVNPGQSVVESFTITRAAYQYQGTYRVSATAGGATSEGRFVVNDGLDVSAVLAPVADEPSLFDVTATVRDVLARDVADLHVEVYFPAGASVPSNPITFNPSLVRAGESASQTWRVQFTERGQTGVVCFAHSEDAGHDRANADADVRGSAKLYCWFEETPVVRRGQAAPMRSWVENIGGVAVDANVTFTVPGDIATTVGSPQVLAGLGAGEKRSIEFSATPSAAGRFAILMEASEPGGSACLAVGPVVAFEASRSLSLAAIPAAVPCSQHSHVRLALTNLSPLDDDVLISSHASNPGVLYAIFDGTARVLGVPVHVAAGSQKNLDLEIQPGIVGACITVNSVSIHDPSAAATTEVQLVGPTPLSEVDVAYSAARYDRRTGQWSTMATIQNTSASPVRSPLYLVINSIAPETITLVEPDGTTADGRPYVDFSALVPSGQLDPGQSVGKRIAFNNPNRVRFRAEMSVYGIVASPPTGPQAAFTIGDLLLMDFDADGDVDLADFTAFADCTGGPGQAAATDCGTAFDSDLDTDVDLADFAAFQAAFGG